MCLRKHVWLSTYPKLLRKFLVCEYVQKYMARDGATPTRFGPRPLNNALGPSFCTMCLEIK